MGSEIDRITPAGGLKKYGKLQGDYVLLKGSVMGPTKRLITLRKIARKSRYPTDPVQLTYIDAEFQKSGD
jgi:large subunit ribosomal protein L3